MRRGWLSGSFFGIRQEQADGFLERGLGDADEEVDGVAGLSGIGADPVMVLDDDVRGRADS